MHPNKVPRASGRETGPQHHRSSPILHSGHEVLFCILIFCVPPDPLRVFVAKNLYLGLIWPKHTVPVEAPVPLSELQTFACEWEKVFSVHASDSAWWLFWRLCDPKMLPQGTGDSMKNYYFLVRDFFLPLKFTWVEGYIFLQFSVWEYASAIKK